MKILYVSSAAGPDYLCDMLFHGLRADGHEVVDVNRLWYMYQGCDKAGLYGKGFTLYGLIEEGSVDRDDIFRKIQAQYFDLVVFGSVHRCHTFVYDVLAAYPGNKIVFIDGEDSPQFLCDFVKVGNYFKRELYTPQGKVNPIQFAIPAEKIVEPLAKDLIMGPLDPLNPATYVYEDEPSYYASYRRSLFGKTMKKAGWDCLRHYEIMACGAIPYFQNLEHCPYTIMMNLPKAELLTAKTLLEFNDGQIFRKASGKEIWQDLMEAIRAKLQSHLTTTALARYVVDRAN